MTDSKYIELLEKQNEQISAILNGRLLDGSKHLFTVIGTIEISKNLYNQVICNRLFGVFDQQTEALIAVDNAFTFFNDYYSDDEINNKVIETLKPLPCFPSRLGGARGSETDPSPTVLLAKSWENVHQSVNIKVNITVLKTKLNSFLNRK